MKITGYQQSVDTGGTTKATIKTVGNALAYGTDGSGLTAMSNAAGQWAAAIERQQENEDRETILNAMDIFNKSRYNIMYNKDSGLMNTKLEGSAGIGQSYSEQIDKARADVLGNIKLHSKKNQLALDHLMYSSAQEGFQTVDRYQQKQHEAVTDLRYGNNIQNSAEYVQKNWNNEGAIDSAVNNAVLMTSLAYGKRGAEFVEAKVRESVGQVAASAINESIINEDYAKTRRYLDKYGSYLTADQRAGFEKIAYTKESSAFDRDTAKALFEKYGGNEQAVRDALSKMSGFSATQETDVEPQTEGSTWVRNNNTVSLNGVKQQVTTGLSDIAKEFNAMSGAQLIVTSGTDSTDIHQAGAHSHGAGVKLDVAADWLENADNRQKFIAYAESKGIKVLDEYAHPSANSTGGHLDLDFTDYKGGGKSTPKPMSVDEQDRIMTQYKRLVAEQKATKSANETKLFEQNLDLLYQLKQNGTTYEDALKWAEQDATTYAQGNSERYVEKAKANKKAVDAVWIDHSKNKGLGVAGKDILADMLRQGKFATELDFIGFAVKEGKANEKDVHSLRNTYKQYQEGTGIFKYDLDAIASDMVPSGIKGEARTKAKLNAKAYANNQIRTYRAQHNGEDPTYSEVVDMVQKGFTDTVSGSYVTSSGWLWDSTKKFNYNKVELAGRGISNISQSPTDPNIYYVDFSNGRNSEVMYADELDKYMGGQAK